MGSWYIEGGTAVPEENYIIDADTFDWDIAMVPSDGVDLSILDVYEVYDYVVFEQSSNSSTASAIATTTAISASTIATTTDIKPSDQISVVFMIALGFTGLLASLLGCIDAAWNHKSRRHSWNIFHLNLANSCVAILLPFAAVARFEGYWRFGDVCYRILGIVFNTGQAACVFQLAYLLFVRCKDVARCEQSTAKVANRLICFMLWPGAMATAWPTAVYEDVLADVLKGEDAQRKEGAKNYIISHVAICFIAPGIFSLLCFIIAFGKKQKNDSHVKTPRSVVKDAKDAGVLFTVLCLCWLPYNVWRILKSNVVGRDVVSDIVLCVATVFSTLMPVIQNLFYRAKANKRNEEMFSADRQETNPLKFESA